MRRFKKLTAAVLAAIMLSLSITACSGSDVINIPVGQRPELQSIDEIIRIALDTTDSSLTGDEMQTVPFEAEDASSELTERQKELYDEMVEKVSKLEDFRYTAAGDGYEVMDDSLIAMGALFADHPEMQNYFMLTDVVEGDTTTAIESLYFLPGDADQQPADKDDLRSEIEMFETVCDRIVSSIPSDYSAYDKYRYLAYIISLTTNYDYENVGGWQDGTAYGSIVGGHSICEGYSIGYRYLCKKADLYCKCVSGVAGDNESHMWNAVRIGEDTYYIDVTWADGCDTLDSEDWLRYFMMPRDVMLIDHAIAEE